MNAPPPQAAPPPPPPTAPRTALDVDQLLRVEALQAAAHWHMGATTYPEDAPDPTHVIHVARAFEAYLRGGDR